MSGSSTSSRHDLGLAPEVVRRRNLLEPTEFPTAMVTGPTLAHVTARETLERALALADVDGFRRAQQRARAVGHAIGFGCATFIDPSPGPPNYSEALGAGASPRTAQRGRRGSNPTAP